MPSQYEQQLAVRLFFLSLLDIRQSRESPGWGDTHHALQDAIKEWNDHCALHLSR